MCGIYCAMFVFWVEVWAHNSIHQLVTWLVKIGHLGFWWNVGWSSGPFPRKVKLWAHISIHQLVIWLVKYGYEGFWQHFLATISFRRIIRVVLEINANEN